MIERAFVERFAAANALVDLKPYMDKSSLNKDMFVKGLMGYSEYNNDGKIVSVPFNRSTPILYYNKTIFKEAGLNPDKGPETWADLKAYAEKLTKREGGKTVRYGLTWPIETWYFKAMVAQLGGRTINEARNDVGFADNGTGVEVLNYWVDFKKSGTFKVAPAQDGTTIARQSFMNGETAMFMESTSYMSSLMKSIGGKFELGAAFLPMNKFRAMPTGGANVAMMSKGKEKDAAWGFFKWMLTDPQGGAEFCLKSGYMPFTKQMIDSPAIQELWKKNPQYKVAFDQLPHAVDTEQHLHWSELKAELKKSLQSVMHDDKDPKDVISNLSKEAKRILKQ
jgi:sn-glycerol 3-phosphate transport system substrate-binding protein